jgi:hypothetical protein
MDRERKMIGSESRANPHFLLECVHMCYLQLEMRNRTIQAGEARKGAGRPEVPEQKKASSTTLATLSHLARVVKLTLHVSMSTVHTSYAEL